MADIQLQTETTRKHSHHHGGCSFCGMPGKCSSHMKLLGNLALVLKCCSTLPLERHAQYCTLLLRTDLLLSCLLGSAASRTAYSKGSSHPASVAPALPYPRAPQTTGRTSFSTTLSYTCQAVAADAFYTHCDGKCCGWAGTGTTSFTGADALKQQKLAQAFTVQAPRLAQQRVSATESPVQHLLVAHIKASLHHFRY